jgi:hypothetical protein
MRSPGEFLPSFEAALKEVITHTDVKYLADGSEVGSAIDTVGVVLNGFTQWFNSVVLLNGLVSGLTQWFYSMVLLNAFPILRYISFTYLHTFKISYTQL